MSTLCVDMYRVAREKVNFEKGLGEVLEKSLLV